MERERGKYHYEMKLVLVGIYEQDLITVIEYVNSLTVAQMKYLLKHQMDYILLDFIQKIKKRANALFLCYLRTSIKPFTYC